MKSVCLAVVLAFTMVAHCSVHNPPLQFPFTLDEVHKRFEGHVYHGVPQGTHVPLFVESGSAAGEGEGTDSSSLESYLQLSLKHGDDIHVLPRSRGETPTPAEADSEPFPRGLEFALVHTEAFDIDDNFFLVVRNPDILLNKAEILFYVTLVTVPNNTVVANPLPFVVHVDHELPSNRHGAAIYAGVIVLVIVAIALLFPFTVRAKRRVQAGKPVCGCGSHAGEDKEGLSRDKQGVDNPVIVVDEAEDTGQETIQEHMMRSVSDIHFQPKWLDPHYREDHHVRIQQPFHMLPSMSPQPPQQAQASKESKKDGDFSVKL